MRECVVHAERVSDFVSRELFEDILASEEEHGACGLAGDVAGTHRKGWGIQNYIQSQIGDVQ